MTKRLLLILLIVPLSLSAQDDLLDEIDTLSAQTTYVSAAFKSLKIVNIETTKMVPEKRLFFVVSHRFGSIKTGIEEFFGLDQAVTRLNFVYGLTDGINIGISRSSFQKTYEASLKLRLARQKKVGMPVTVVLFHSLQFNGFLDDADLPGLKFEHRLGYATQLLLSHKATRNLSLLAAPTYFHDNLTLLGSQENAQFGLGLGGRLKISRRCALNLDYGLHLNRTRDSPFRNPLSIGLDIETGGHVFQLHFTNSQPMNVNTSLGQATGDWGTGDIFFGFNLVRIF